MNAKKKQYLHDFEGLYSLNTGELKSLWYTYFENKPHRIRADYLRGELSYKIQSKLYGGLGKIAKNKLKRLSVQTEIKTRSKFNLPEGAKLVRTWRDSQHHVTAIRDGGFEYQGAIYKSLSKIAFVITGSKWSGPVFFGLKKGHSNDN